MKQKEERERILDIVKFYEGRPADFGGGDPEASHGEIDHAVYAAFRLVLEDSNDRENWLVAKRVGALMDVAENRERWYA